MVRSTDILLYLVANSPRPFTRTELVKLLYLVDWEYVKTHGDQASEVDWIRDYYGPSASSVIGGLHELQQCNQIRVIYTNNFYGTKMFLHSLAEDAVMPILPEDVTETCDWVLKEYGRLSLARIKAAAYDTPPMRHILEQEDEEEGKKLYGRHLDLKRFKPRGRKRIARARVVLTRRGSPREQRVATIAEYQKWQNSIAEANEAGMGGESNAY